MSNTSFLTFLIIISCNNHVSHQSPDQHDSNHIIILKDPMPEAPEQHIILDFLNHDQHHNPNYHECNQVFSPEIHTVKHLSHTSFSIVLIMMSTILMEVIIHILPDIHCLKHLSHTSFSAVLRLPPTVSSAAPVVEGGDFSADCRFLRQSRLHTVGIKMILTEYFDCQHD